MVDRFQTPLGGAPRGIRLGQLLNVQNTPPASAHLLVYDTAVGKWGPGLAVAGSLADNAVTTPKVADGAVTFAKLNADVGPGFDSRWVNVAGDTMTGALALPSNGLNVGAGQLQVTGGNVQATGYLTANGGALFGNSWGGTAAVQLSGASGAVVNDGGSLGFRKTRSTDPLSHVIVADLDSLGAIYFAGSDGGTFLSAARIRGRVDGTPASGAMPGYLDFSTTARAGNPDSESTTAPTERVRVTHEGFVGVNVTAPAAQVEVLAKRAGTVGLRVRAQAGATADVWQATSNGGSVWFGVRGDGYLKTLGSLLTAATAVTGLSKVLRVYDEGGTVYYVPLYSGYS